MTSTPEFLEVSSKKLVRATPDIFSIAVDQNALFCL